MRSELGIEAAASPDRFLAAEAEALARCRGGDREAYRLLVDLHERAITAVVSRIIVRPREEIEDLVQETFIQGFVKIRSFRGESGYRTWLYRIAVNLSLRRLEQLRRKGWTPLDAMDDVELPDLREDAILPEREALRSEESRLLRNALLKLSDNHRTVVVLRYFEEKECSEIAEIMGCSIGTVWSRLHHALKKLKGLLPEP